MKRETFEQLLRDGADVAFGEIVEAVKNARCNLFLGAAVHAPPPKELAAVGYNYPAIQRPPVGSALACILNEVCKYSERFPDEPLWNLQRVAQDFEAEKGRPALIQAVRAAVETGREPSAALRALAKLNFRVIITTNYDTLLQKALGLAGKGDAFISSYQSNEKGLPAVTRDLPWDVKATPECPFVFKMHGDIADPHSLVITEEDYIQFIMRMRDSGDFVPVPATVSEALRSAATLFIGYSLKDYNLRLLLKALRSIGQRQHFPPTYSVDLSPDPLIWHVWSKEQKYVNFVAWDVWAFVPRLYREVTGEDMPK